MSPTAGQQDICRASSFSHFPNWDFIVDTWGLEYLMLCSMCWYNRTKPAADATESFSAVFVRLLVEPRLLVKHPTSSRETSWWNGESGGEKCPSNSFLFSCTKLIGARRRVESVNLHFMTWWIAPVNWINHQLPISVSPAAIIIFENELRAYRHFFSRFPSSWAQFVRPWHIARSSEHEEFHLLSPPQKGSDVFRILRAIHPRAAAAQLLNVRVIITHDDDDHHHCNSYPS